MKHALWIGTLASLTALVIEGESLACGGCFHPPTADSVVTGHRMVFAISPTRTVLWDQIQYSGVPGEFGWVLPITPGATIEASTDAWFESLDAWTSARIAAPQLSCTFAQGGSSGYYGGESGCCASADMSHSGAAVAEDAGVLVPPPVTVLHQGTVGPYETVTLRSSDAGSLRTWLAAHNYVVPADISPIIDAYIAEGADFIALRLIPGTGVDRMTPVRVVTPSGRGILPLRMVQAGTGSAVDIVLYVVGEQRYALSDLTEVQLDATSLSYDFKSSSSNYEALRSAALSQQNGFVFLTTFAQWNPFATNSSERAFAAGNLTNANTLGILYFAQAFSDSGQTFPGCTATLSALSSNLLVTNTRSQVDAGGMGQIDSGAVVDSGSTGQVDSGPPTSMNASDLDCSPQFTDLSAALIGMHPSQAWLTRMEMHLPREALTMDCHVAPDPIQSTLTNSWTAAKSTNVPAGCVVAASSTASAHPPRRRPTTPIWSLAMFALAGATRRLGRRRAGSAAGNGAGRTRTD